MHNVNRLVITFLLNSLWQIALITATGWICSRLLRNVRGRHLYRMWTTCLVLSVLLPLLSLFYPAAILPRILTSPFTASAGPGESNPASWQGAWLRFLHAGFSFDPRFMACISALYFIFLAGSLVWLFRSWQKAKQIQRSAHTCELASSISTIVRRCQKVFGLESIPILCSDFVRGPMTTGIHRPVVIVPAFLFTRNLEEEWSCVLAHEFAHIRRRDCLFYLLQQLLYWPISFHPAARIIKREISAARELVCDEMATEHMVDRTTYARCLVSIAGMMPSVRTPQPDYSLGIFDAGILEERIMKLLQNNSSPAFWRKTALLTTAVLLTLCISVSAFSFKINGNANTVSLAWFAATSPGDEPLKLGPGITRPKLISKINPSYPAEAKKAKRQGTVVLDVVISDTGVTEDVHVIKSLAPDLDDSAMAAVRQWKFEPASKDGKPVKVETHIVVNFSLK